MEDGFITFVKTISAPAATKMEEEKITSDLVCHMSDEELSNYLPHHGERIRLRTYLKKDLEPQKKKSKLLTILKQKLTDVSQDSDNITGAEMRNPHRPFGNRNASKQFRLIELGWIHKTGQRSTQVRKNKGGGTRKMEVPKMATKTKIMEEAISLFFPNGISAKGPISKFNFDLWDFSDRPIDMDTTVAEMYDKTKMPLLRFYLSTSQKDHVELEQITNPGSDESPPIKDQPTPATGTSKELDDLGQKQKKGHEDNTDIISQAMEIAGLPALDVDEDDFLPDPIFHPTQQSSSVPLSIKEHMLKLHRGHLLRELIVAFKDIDPMNDIINIQMVMPDGTYESAEDGGGVTRDALSDFWTSFYDQCTIGTKFKIPFLRHDFAEKEWESVAKIMAFGWKCCGYFPVKMSLPFLQICLYGTVSASILDSFFEIIPEDESATLKKCLADFESVEMDDLIDILQMYNSKTLPKADNIVGLLKEIAHKEIIQTPMFIVDCFQPVLKNLHIAEDQLRKLYTDLIPTPKLVNKMLQFPDTMCSDEQTVSNHLRRFIRELNNETLRKFVRFCTGSDLMVNKEINVNLVNVSGLARRPVAHTCFCLLELSKTYESFPQFRSEFLAVLETNVWVMDII